MRTGLGRVARACCGNVLQIRALHRLVHGESAVFILLSPPIKGASAQGLQCLKFLPMTSIPTANPQVELHAKSVPSTEGGPSRPKPHVVSSAVEHPAITKCLDYLVSEGRVEVTYVGVDEEGRVSVENVLAAFRPETALVTIMHSNNEVPRRKMAK